ncbi:MAG: hypothetical protein A2W30_06505 [Ignavibacteria bacterium RBG_16_36_9]|nr:MAG: hypothetical protein A2W30_06505 [Ignavibacteria bacterium RBG_16_36_9]
MKKKYLVCHLLFEEFPRDPRVRRYVTSLNQTDIYCIIICSKKKGNKYFESWNGNLVYRIPISKQRKSFFLTSLEYAGFTFLSVFVLAFLGIKYKFRIIHVHTLPDTLIFATAFNKLFGTKLILDLHEIFPELFCARKPHLENSFLVRILKLSEKCSLKFANTIITIHDPAKEIFIKRNKGIENKIHVIMNGVDNNEYRNAVLVPTDRFIIIYNGTVVKLLNLTMIIEALAQLKDLMAGIDFGKISFRIFGDGPALHEIFSLAEKLEVKDKVEYLGYLAPSDMRIEILKSSVLILPPLKNIYSDLFYTTKLIECICLKIPVIATRLNTYERYYRDESLFYFDSGNLSQLVRRIEEVYYNKALVRQKTENAFKDYQKVEWNKMKNRYIRVVQSLSV